jgi:hypothetical protein
LSGRAVSAFFLAALVVAPWSRSVAQVDPNTPPPALGAGTAAPFLFGGWVGRPEPGATRHDWQKQKSPRVALIASLLWPGLGQMYNEREFWAVVVAGFEFYFIGNWISEQRLTNHYRAIANADPANEEARVLFVLHQDERIQSAWLLGFTILLSGIQAYVDAHLFDFDAKPPVRFAPSMNGAPSAGLQIRF